MEECYNKTYWQNNKPIQANGLPAHLGHIHHIHAENSNGT